MGVSRIHVAVFCGGRGSASIVRALAAEADVDLDLVVNAYDDGQSTGALRRLFPDLPAPSDFRKNLAVLAGGAVADLLERRIDLPGDLPGLLKLLEGDAGPARNLAGPIARFASEAPGASISDCAVGNLAIAGAWLGCGRDFNRAVADLAQALGVGARLLNVDTGTSRYLVGLKADGELLPGESAIVAPQSDTPITALFLLAAPLDAERRRELDGLDVAARRARLESWQAPARISAEASGALYDADVVIYGPGTPFSSLLPSYAVRGIPDAIAGGRARARILVVNLRQDHDMRGLAATDLVDRALAALGDPANARGFVTHVLGDAAAPDRPGGVARGAVTGGSYRGATWIDAELEDPARPGLHDGARVVRVALSLGPERRGALAASSERLP